MTLTTRHLVPIAVTGLLLAGCGTAPEPQGVCDRYAELQASVEELRATPPAADDVEQLRATADQLREQADALSDLLDRIQAASDGRLDQAIGQARQQVDELRAALATAKYQKAETLAAQLDEVRDELRTTLAPLKNLLDSQCAAG